MGNKTGISWTDATWNPVRGCSRVSEGCRNCYAERVAARFSDPGMPYHGLARRKLTIVNNEERDPGNKREARWTGVVRMVPDHLADPLRWKRPRRIFVNSMSDLFHEAIPDDVIDRVVAVMMICCLHETKGGHTFQTLTKRAARMSAYFNDPKTQERVARAAAQLMEDADGWYDLIAFRKEGLVHPLMWWGVSVENQETADERIPELLRTPAVVRFLSCEPLIGPVDLAAASPNARSFAEDLDWIIAGCESGPGARPCDVAWLRSLRDQCASSDVAFFLKQAEGKLEVVEAGQSLPSLPRMAKLSITGGDGSHKKGRGHSATIFELPYLDGVQHAAFPKLVGYE